MKSAQNRRSGRAVAVATIMMLAICGSGGTAWGQLVADPAAPGGTARLDPLHADVLPADGDGFVPVRFRPDGDPALNIRAGASGWDLSRNGEIRMHLQNAMAWPVTVDIRLVDLSGGTLEARIGLPPGGPLTLTIPLQATQPRRWGMLAGPPIPWMQDKAPVAVVLATSGQLDRSRVASLRLAMPRPDAPQTLRMGKVFLESDPATPDAQERLAYAGIVDAYGQYTRGEWEEKYRPQDPEHKSASEADTAFARFAQSLDRLPTPEAGARAEETRVDPYGGLLDVDMEGIAPVTPGGADVKPAGQGFFRTAKATNAHGPARWLLLTPLGNPFFSIGVNAVQLENSQTFVEGREFMFEALPQQGDPLARFGGRQDSAESLPLDAGAQRGRGYGKGATFDFYRANLYRRDGADFGRHWLTRTRNRLLQWNFNTIGSWSDLALGRQARIPYTRTIQVEGDFSRLSDGSDWWSGIPDVFDPRFEQALERAVEAEAKPLKDDPYLIGYFIDNELGWGNGSATDPAARYALAYSALRGDAGAPGSHAKRALLDLLRSRHDGSIEKLSASWKKRYRSWESLEPALGAAELPDGRVAGVAADFAAFLQLHADRYFSQVAATLRRHDPHHLYLGARFASRTPEAVQACARWCDVLSFNLYVPTLDSGFDAEALRRLDKPALLTEFHFGSNDRGPFWPGLIPVAAEADRGPAYDRMLKSVLANPDFLGAHWFQYLDQAVTGRWLDGENGHLGLVAITDIPWNGFVSDVRRTNRQARLTLREQLKARR